jgi:predicted extracellular nuclease
LIRRLFNLMCLVSTVALCCCSAAPETTTIQEPVTPIHTVQGNQHVSPMIDQPVVIEGIITDISDNDVSLQDPNADDNPHTSEAILVRGKKGQLHGLSCGDRIRVSGTVREIINNRRPQGLPVTTLLAEHYQVVSRRQPLPTAIVIGENGRRPPHAIIDDDSAGQVDDKATAGAFDPENDGLDFWESLENMRVEIREALVIGSVYRNEFPALADAGRGASGLNTRNALVLSLSDGNPERLTIDAGRKIDRTEYGGGGLFEQPITGVLYYDWGRYKLVADHPLPKPRQKPPAPEETKLVGTADHLTIASYNVENLHPRAMTDTGEQRIAVVAASIREALGAPDIIALQEIQDDSGPRNNGVVTSSKTYQGLIAHLAPIPYAWCDISPINLADGGQPGGNIRCAYLYRTDRVKLIQRGAAGSMDAAKAVSGPALSLSPGRVAPTHQAFINTRKCLAAEFEFNGHKLFVINCHLNSKRGDAPMFGRLQPHTSQSAIVRQQQAQVIQAFVRQLKRQKATNIIVLGDLNDFAFSDTLQVLTGKNLENLMLKLPAADRYTYNYQGNAQALDHAFISSALRRNAAPEIDVVHINCEFPTGTRASDHDPLVVRLHLPEL